MKVKVAKSINFEEVPDYVLETVEQIKNDLQTCLDNITALSVTLREDEALHVSISIVEKTRQKSIDTDLLLQDISEILNGYLSAIVNMKEKELQKQLSETEALAAEYNVQAQSAIASLQEESTDVNEEGNRDDD